MVGTNPTFLKERRRRRPESSEQYKVAFLFSFTRVTVATARPEPGLERPCWNGHYRWYRPQERSAAPRHVTLCPAIRPMLHTQVRRCGHEYSTALCHRPGTRTPCVNSEFDVVLLGQI